MRRSPALLASLLLLVAGVVAPMGVVGQDAPETNPLIVSMNGTTNYLTVPDDDVARTGTTSDGLSLSTAIDGDTATLQSELIRTSFEQAFEEAGSDAEKTAAIRSAADRIERRHRGLERRDSAATQAYANGSMTAAQFARERARIHQEATHLRETTDRIRTVVRNDNSFSPSLSLGSRLTGLSGELEALQGPVSEHAAQAAGGDARGEYIYAEAGGDGYTLAYVTDDSYVRETYLGSEHHHNDTDDSAPNNITSQNAALDRGNELYPWASNHSISPNVRYLGSAENYKYTTQHTSGELTVFLNARTGNVFRESQRHKLSAMPVSNTVTNSNGTLDMRVNKTFESGPLKVELTRNDTSVPMDGTVTVDGEPVGQTGDDGTLWIVEPRGPDRIEASTGDNATVGVYLPS